MDAQAPITYVERTSSTQDIIRTDISAPAYTSVVANEQTHGRGRLGRTWESPAGASLLVSTLLRIPASPAARENLGWTTFMTALAARAALGAALTDALSTTDVATTSAPAVEVKWPNDVVVNGRKLAGVIGEFLGEDNGNLVVSVGLGANLTQTSNQLIDGATSLAVECTALGCTPVTSDSLAQRDCILATYLSELAGRVDRFSTEAIVAEYNSHLAGRGAPSTARLADGTHIEGTIHAVDASGSLVVRTPHGDVQVTPADAAMFNYRGDK